VQSFLGMLDGLMAYFALFVAQKMVKGHGPYRHGLKRYKCKACKRTFNDKTGTIFHYSRLSLKEWFMLISLYLGLHNSCLSLSWLLERSYMTIFKALKKLILKLKFKLLKMEGSIEIDETYIKAGLKGRNNNLRIKRLGRKPRHRGLKRRGRGSWHKDIPAIFILAERKGLEDYTPSSNVEAKTALRLIERRIAKGSIIYTDCFKAYSSLSEIGYRHEAINHSIGEYAKGDCHVNGCENKASLLKPWLALHRGISKDNLGLYLTAFKACRKARKLKPIEAIEKLLKEVIFLFLLLAIIEEACLSQIKPQPQNLYLRA
jgi:transposase-like protein